MAPIQEQTYKMKIVIKNRNSTASEMMHKTIRELLED